MYLTLKRTNFADKKKKLAHTCSNIKHMYAKPKNPDAERHRNISSSFRHHLKQVSCKVDSREGAALAGGSGAVRS